MLKHGVSSIPVVGHNHQVSMVGLMDILVHAVDTFDKAAGTKKAFTDLFDVSTEELTGVLRSPTTGVTHVTHCSSLLSLGDESHTIQGCLHRHASQGDDPHHGQLTLA